MAMLEKQHYRKAYTKINYCINGILVPIYKYAEATLKTNRRLPFELCYPTSSENYSLKYVSHCNKQG